MSKQPTSGKRVQGRSEAQRLAELRIELERKAKRRAEAEARALRTPERKEHGSEGAT